MVFFVFLLEFGAVPTVRYLMFSYWSLQLFLQCGIFVFLLKFGAVPTAWYLLFFY